MSEPLRVLLVGGTHGNELTGTHLVRSWLKAGRLSQWPELQIDTLLANSGAISENRRYLDADLNRQFSREMLTLKPEHFEGRRAAEIVVQLGGKPSVKYDFIIDLHTTTANMKTTLVVNGHSPLAIQSAAHVHNLQQNVHILHHDVNPEDDSFLISLGKMGGIIVEIGPIAQGLLNAEVYHTTETTLINILDYLSKWCLNSSEMENTLPDKLAAFQFVEKISMPVNEHGELSAMIHADFQGQDFQPLKPGQPLFQLFSGETVKYSGPEGFSASFINEAAYYDQNHGFSRVKPVQLVVAKSS